MDLTLWSSRAPTEVWVDASVRNPCASGCVKRAAKTQGTAAHLATVDKARRYGGSKVICAAAESFGFLGTGMEALFDHIAEFAPRRPPKGRRQQWELRIGMVIARSLARAFRGSGME